MYNVMRLEDWGIEIQTSNPCLIFFKETAAHWETPRKKVFFNIPDVKEFVLSLTRFSFSAFSAHDHWLLIRKGQDPEQAVEIILKSVADNSEETMVFSSDELHDLISLMSHQVWYPDH